ncbi:hypothetical protein L2E82_13615 [Cichorium intybus]|uniref:Uncharacterized protein n=1 Tax=Cichorium intybus TaxID=13427 RepID=A0ACB9EXQ7_CICIN|nr:hypothetical protein L2E82_13615 [Cichorium intybus]
MGDFPSGFFGITDPKPWRCQRSDEKTCRCSRHVALNQKYRERHINSGHHRSRKPVEGHSSQAVSSPAKVGSVVSSSSASVSRFI